MAQNPSDFLIRKIRQKFEELNPTNDPHKAVWLMSIENELEESIPGLMTAAYVGHTVKTNNPLTPHVYPAARCIAEGTHRIATQEEIESYLAKNEADRVANIQTEKDKKMSITNQMSFPPEFMAMFAAWQASQQQNTEEPTKKASKSK